MSRKIAQIEFTLHWRSAQASHRDGYYAPKVNFWRDILPPPLAALESAAEEARARAMLAAGESIPAYDRSRRVKLRPAQFDREAVPGMTLEPDSGRYYPSGFLQGVSGCFRGDHSPACCLASDEASLLFDLNHPLAGREVAIEGQVVALETVGGQEHGGACFDWAESAAANGPGMQAREAPAPRLRLDAAALARLDETPDSIFYSLTRTLPHIDRQASALLARLYDELLAPGMRVLDLMSSCQSHLPAGLELQELVGLGMNREELAQNPRLTSQVVQDLNQDPKLPFEESRFEAVICNLSIEYLIRPHEVISEVARVLAPGGLFVATFSNRWFPPKVIQLWPQLHEFERMGLVLDYLLQHGGFTDLHTWSMRGYPRPAEDPHADRLANADPLYAVWGRKG